MTVSEAFSLFITPLSTLSLIGGFSLPRRRSVSDPFIIKIIEIKKVPVKDLSIGTFFTFLCGFFYF